MDNVPVKILFFAKASELSGTKQKIVNLPVVIDHASLREKIVEDFNLKEIQKNIILAVNEEFVTDKVLNLKAGDEIAVIPPLSGGIYHDINKYL